MSKFVSIEGFDNYVINDKGIVKNTRKPEGRNRVVSTRAKSSHALRILLSKNGFSYSFRLDTLVAKHFVANPNKFKYLDNISGDNSDVSATNLVYVESPPHRGIISNNLIAAMSRKFLKSKKSFKEFAKEYDYTASNIRKLVYQWCEDNDKMDEYAKITRANQVRYLNTRLYTATVAIDQYSLDGKLIASHNSVTEAAEAVGVKPPSISRALQSVYRTSGGYRWKYQSQKKTP